MLRFVGALVVAWAVASGAQATRAGYEADRFNTILSFMHV